MPGSVSQNENILKYCKNKEVPQSVAPVAPVAPSVAPSVVPGMALNPRREISQTANILKYSKNAPIRSRYTSPGAHASRKKTGIK